MLVFAVGLIVVESAAVPIIDIESRAVGVEPPEKLEVKKT